MTPPSLPLRAWYACSYYLGLFLFLFGILLLQTFSLLGLVLPPSAGVQRFVRSAVRRYLQAYFLYLRGANSLRASWEGWQESFATEPGIIVANHPSMLDAPFLLSRLPRAVVIFKARLGRHILRGRAAAFTGYMPSDQGVDGLRLVVGSVRAGAQFVFFPEGTRTPREGPVELHPLYAVVAKYARVPIHLFAIERNSNALCKDHVLRRSPILPARFRIRYLETVGCDEAPTAALLHERVAERLRPVIEANREPLEASLYAGCTVVERGPEQIEWRLRVPAGGWWFAGHFPGYPIAPGALSVHWILRAWEWGPGTRLGPARLRRVRFLKEVRPGATLRLVLEKKGAGWKAVLSEEGETISTANLEGAGR